MCARCVRGANMQLSCPTFSKDLSLTSRPISRHLATVMMSTTSTMTSTRTMTIHSVSLMSANTHTHRHATLLYHV